MVRLQVPGPVADLWDGWAGKYVIYTHKNTGIMGDAFAASAEKGERIFTLACDRLEKLVREYHELPVRHYREFGSHCP